MKIIFWTASILIIVLVFWGCLNLNNKTQNDSSSGGESGQPTSNGGEAGEIFCPLPKEERNYSIDDSESCNHSSLDCESSGE